MDPLLLALTFAGGVAAGVINTLAGGGGLIALPILIASGLSATVANGTYRLAVVLQNAAAVATFHRRGVRVAGTVWPLLLPCVVGAVLGARLAVAVDEDLFRKVLGGVLVVMLVLFLVRRPPAPRAGDGFRIRPWMWATYFALGVYGGFLQVGIGFLFLALLAGVGGLDLVRANAIKVFLILGYSTAAVILFAAGGRFALAPAVVMAAGNAIGGWLGARIAVDKGEVWIRAVLAVAVLASAAELTGVWPRIASVLGL